MEASSRGVSCRLTIFYRDPGPPGWESLLRAGMVAAHSLIVSYDVRRWACVEAYARLGGGWLRLRVEGASVRGLAVQETSLEGLLRSLLRGDRWPGITLSRVPEPPAEPAGCTPVDAVIAGGAAAGCPDCVVVKGIEGRLQPWWAAAAAMVVLDEPCGGCIQPAR